MRQRVVGAVRDRVPATLQSGMWSLDGRSVVILVAVGVAAVLAAAVLLRGSPSVQSVVTATVTPAVVTADQGPDPDATAGTDAEDVAAAVPGATQAPAQATVVVHVAGLVARPGVYDLPAGSRVVDALAAAGGAIEGTDLSQLNLARIVVDGEQVAVGVPPAPGAAPPGGGAAGQVSTGPAEPLDLNAATESDLDALPGVGPVLAARIIAWRQEHGRFSSVQELLEVSGIGESTLSDIAPLVRV